MKISCIIFISINLLVVKSIKEVDIFKTFERKSVKKRVIIKKFKKENIHNRIRFRLDKLIPQRIEKRLFDSEKKKNNFFKNKIETLIKPQKTIKTTKTTKITSPEFPKSISKSSKPEYKTIKIIYDLTFLKKTLQNFDKLSKLGAIKNLLSKSDSIFKRYIKIKKNNKNIKIPKNFSECENSKISGNRFDFKSSNFPLEKTYDGDLVIFVSSFSENSETLASASPCSKDDLDNRIKVGRLNLNLEKMVFEKDDEFEFKRSVETVVHEILHILAFHSFVQENVFKDRNLLKHSKHLEKLFLFYQKKGGVLDPLVDSAHWDNFYLKNDIMNEKEQDDSILSIFSLEYINLVNRDLNFDITKYRGNGEIIEDERFWGYNCEKDSLEGRKSAYPWLCTGWERENDKFGCSVDFQSKAQCSKTQDLDSKCHQKFIVNKGHCRDSRNNRDKEFDFENFGEHSRCFALRENFGSACLDFEIKNVNDNKMIQIKIENTILNCEKEGQIVDFRYTDSKDGVVYLDSIRCPDLKDFEEQLGYNKCPYQCNFNGTCVNGVCDCYAGYNQEDNCASRLNNSQNIYTTYFNEV